MFHARSPSAVLRPRGLRTWGARSTSDENHPERIDVRCPAKVSNLGQTLGRHGKRSGRRNRVSQRARAHPMPTMRPRPLPQARCFVETTRHGDDQRSRIGACSWSAWIASITSATVTSARHTIEGGPCPAARVEANSSRNAFDQLRNKEGAFASSRSTPRTRDAAGCKSPGRLNSDSSASRGARPIEERLIEVRQRSEVAPFRPMAPPRYAPTIQPAPDGRTHDAQQRPPARLIRDAAGCRIALRTRTARRYDAFAGRTSRTAWRVPGKVPGKEEKRLQLLSLRSLINHRVPCRRRFRCAALTSDRSTRNRLYALQPASFVRIAPA